MADVFLQSAPDASLPFYAAQLYWQAAVSGVPGLAGASDRQDLAAPGILQQQRERGVERYRSEQEAENGSGLRNRPAAGEFGDSGH